MNGLAIVGRTRSEYLDEAPSGTCITKVYIM